MINNIFVSCKNHNFNINTYLTEINKKDVFEIHLAGHSINTYDNNAILIDDHGSKVSDKVWDLYKKSLQLFGKKPTLIEWDNNIPPLHTLIDESIKAEKIATTIYS